MEFILIFKTRPQKKMAWVVHQPLSSLFHYSSGSWRMVWIFLKLLEEAGQNRASISNAALSSLKNVSYIASHIRNSKFSSSHIKKRKREKGNCNDIFYLTHIQIVIISTCNLYKNMEIFYFLCTNSSKFYFYFILTAHLNSI